MILTFNEKLFNIKTMFKNKTIIVSMILILIIPSFAKKRKIDIFNLMKDRKPSKVKLITTSILMKDRTLAINYIKVRNRIYLTKKKRKFRLIFKASIKHILENRRYKFINSDNERSTSFELYSKDGNSLLILSPLKFKWENMESDIGLINYGLRESNKMIMFLKSRYKKKGIDLGIELGKFFNDIRKNLLNAKLFFDLNKYFQTQITLSNMEDFSSYEYLLSDTSKSYNNEFFETFSIIKKSPNYKFKLTQQYSKIGILSYNLYGFALNGDKNSLSGYLGGGYLYKVKDIGENSFYVKMGILKKLGYYKIGFEYPFVINKRQNIAYFNRLYYRFTPKIKFNTYIGFLDSELFLNFYFTKDKISYIWGIRKFNL